MTVPTQTHGARQEHCRATTLRSLNDALRQSFVGGRIVVSRGVAALPAAARSCLLAAVQGFSDFSEGNDPYAEHDFGTVEQDGERYFWKINAYDQRLQFGSPDPADPSVTTRVLTVMRADEY